MPQATKKQPLAKSGDVQKAGSRQPISILEDTDRLFNEFLSRNWLTPFRFEWPRESLIHSTAGMKVPNVDVVDRDSEIMIQAEIPGVDKSDLDVSMTDNTVTIKGSSRSEKKEEKGNFYRQEISQGSFSRTLSLPCEVNAEKVKSSFENGVLELVVPKVKTVKRHKIKL